VQTRVGCRWQWVFANSEDDLDRFRIDLDTFDEGANQLSAPVPIQPFKPITDTGAKCLKAADDELQISFLPGQVACLLGLCLQRLKPFFEVPDTRFGFAFLQVTLGVSVNQARDAISYLRNLLFQQIDIGCSRQYLHRIQPSLVFIGQAPWVLQ
jgi:hypothetical protein